MNENYAGQSVESSDIMKVLMALKLNINRDLKVASLGIVKSINNDEYFVEQFPLLENEKAKRITCYKLENLTININDAVLVLFLDRNFLQNLKQLKSGNKLSLSTNNTELHSEKFGIIIGIILKSKES